MSVSVVVVESARRDLAASARSVGIDVVSAIDLQALKALDQGRPAPEVLLVDLRGQNQFPPDLAAFKRRHPRTGVVIVIDQLDPTLMLDAMRAGITEVVPEPFAGPDLRAAVERLAGRHDDAAAGPSRTMAFVGAKGGVGTTTLAVNVAAVLASRKVSVLMLDLHVTGHGDAALFLGVEPHFSVVDALENLHRLDGSFLRSLVVRAKSGVDVLAAPALPSVRQPEAQQIRELMTRLAAQYEYVVVDVPQSDMGMVDAIDAVSSLTLVLNQELPTVRRASQIASLLRQRYGKDRVGAVVNRYDPRAEIGQDDIERVVGLPVWSVLPSDYRRAVAAANVGKPIVSEPGSRLATTVQDLTKRLAAMAPESTVAPTPPPARSLRKVGGFF